MFQLDSFNTIRDSYFDISTKTATESIMTDKTKSQKDRCEDVQFLQKLKRNEYVAFGNKDKQFTKRSLKRFKQKSKPVPKELEQSPLVSYLVVVIRKQFNTKFGYLFQVATIDSQSEDLDFTNFPSCSSRQQLLVSNYIH